MPQGILAAPTHHPRLWRTFQLTWPPCPLEPSARHQESGKRGLHPKPFAPKYGRMTRRPGVVPRPNQMEYGLGYKKQSPIARMHRNQASGPKLNQTITKANLDHRAKKHDPKSKGHPKNPTVNLQPRSPESPQTLRLKKPQAKPPNQNKNQQGLGVRV